MMFPCNTVPDCNDFGDAVSPDPKSLTGVWIDFENINISWEDIKKTEKVKTAHFFNLIEEIIGTRTETVIVKIFFSEIDLFKITSLIFDETDPLWKRYRIKTPYLNINDALELRYVEGKVARPAKKLEFIQCWMKGKIDHGTLKSTLDTWLVTDIVATLYETPQLKNFVVVAGDADYAPAIRHLQSKGKMVVVIFDEQATSGQLRKEMQDPSSDERSYTFIGLREWIRSKK